MYLEIFSADFAVFRVFWEFRGISRKYLNFAGPRPREISEALHSNGDLFTCEDNHGIKLLGFPGEHAKASNRWD